MAAAHRAGPSGWPPRALAHGLSAVEMVVTMTVAAVLLAVAVPSFSSAMARMRLEGAANELGIDVQYARSEAVRRRASVTLATDATGAGYALAAGDTAIKRVDMPAGVTLDGSRDISFEPLRGGANSTSLTLRSSQTSGTLRMVAGGMGRVQLCSPGGGFTGYPAC